MAGIRVRLQFPDEEKYWIYVDYAHMKTVQDVVSSISEKFSVACDKIFLDDAQLPLKESVFVIQETDLLRVHLKNKNKRKAESPVQENVPPTLIESNKDSTKKKRKKTKDEETPIQSDFQSTSIGLVTTKNKMKKVAQELSQSEEVKNTDAITLDTVAETNRSCSKSQSEKQTTEPKKKHVEESKTNDTQKLQELQENTNHIENQSNQTLENSVCDGDEDEQGKRKRRRRKRKSHYKEETMSTELKTSQLETPVAVDYIPCHATNRKHIRFEASGERGIENHAETHLDNHADSPVEKLTQAATNVKTQKIKAPAQLFPDEKFNPFFEETSKKQNSPLQRKQPAYEKPSMPAKTSTPRNAHQPHNCSSAEISQFGALLSLRSAVFTRTTSSPTKPAAPTYSNVPPPQSLVTEESSYTSKSQTVVEPRTVTSEAATSADKLDVTKFPLFPGPPRVDDVIAFKILELSDNYNPEISEYIIGRISTINANGELTIELKEPRAKRHAFGKFELYQNEEEDAEEVPEVEMETSMSCQWNQMIEPRLIFP